MITKDPASDSRAFTGDYHVVGVQSGNSTESWSTLEKAVKAAKILNDHNANCGHAERYVVTSDEKGSQ